MNIATIRKIAGREEIEYQFLLSMLSEYSHPRDKITEWLKSGELIRIKKGLYVFGPEIALKPYSLEVLANQIYGPSAISLNYALSFYGLIPERVITVTSITNKKNKSFSTPVGEFTYRYINPDKFPVGIELGGKSGQAPFLIASPEKALCDHIHLTDKKIPLLSLENIENYLLNDLRIDPIALRSLKTSKLDLLAKQYEDKRLNLLVQYFKKWKQS